MKTRFHAVIDFEVKSHEFHMASFVNALLQALYKHETKQVCRKYQNYTCKFDWVCMMIKRKQRMVITHNVN